MYLKSGAILKNATFAITVVPAVMDFHFLVMEKSWKSVLEKRGDPAVWMLSIIVEGNVTLCSSLCILTSKCKCVCYTADGNCSFGHCEPLHSRPRTVARDDGRFLAHGLGTKVVTDCDVDNRVRTRSGQMSPVLAGAVRRVHAVW